MKRRIYVISCFLIVCIILALVWGINKHNRNRITICNQTADLVDNLFVEVTYGNSKQQIAVEDIQSQNEKTINVKLPNDFTEGSISLCYIDNNNNIHSQTIIGYIERYSKFDIWISIKSVMNDGSLELFQR